VVLAKRLAAWADVVIENFTPGTMARLGLDYATLAPLNPGLVMLATCNQGQTGPRASHPGFGSHLSSLGGFTHLTGFPQGSPQLLYGPYIDYIAVGFGVTAVLAALEYRRRMGRGQYVDLSQYEAGLQFLTVALLEAASNGRVMNREGNRSPYAAPHGVYPCQGEDRWIALSVWNDAEWACLAPLIGAEGWATDLVWATFAGRKAREDELDKRLAAWSVGWVAEPLAERLQAAGIRAAPVASMADLFADLQLKYRGIWQPLQHSEIGEYHGEGPPFRLSATPAALTRPAPMLGEHTRVVCREILGVSDDEFARLEAAGVFE
jgi:crotonobetainyl-CoA:carnitine CoA-transferase CaiB-like acyl-CoA transferase